MRPNISWPSLTQRRVAQPNTEGVSKLREKQETWINGSFLPTSSMFHENVCKQANSRSCLFQTNLRRPHCTEWLSWSSRGQRQLFSRDPVDTKAAQFWTKVRYWKQTVVIWHKYITLTYPNEVVVAKHAAESPSTCLTSKFASICPPEKGWIFNPNCEGPWWFQMLQGTKTCSNRNMANHSTNVQRPPLSPPCLISWSDLWTLREALNVISLPVDMVGYQKYMLVKSTVSRLKRLLARNSS